LLIVCFLFCETNIGFDNGKQKIYIFSRNGEIKKITTASIEEFVKASPPIACYSLISLVAGADGGLQVKSSGQHYYIFKTIDGSVIGSMQLSDLSEYGSIGTGPFYKIISDLLDNLNKENIFPPGSYEVRLLNCGHTGVEALWLSSDSKDKINDRIYPLDLTQVGLLHSKYYTTKEFLKVILPIFPDGLD